MRRIGSYILVLLGLFFIFLMPMPRWYTYPRVRKAPLDLETTIVATGPGQYFSLSRLQTVNSVQLRNRTSVRLISLWLPMAAPDLAVAAIAAGLVLAAGVTPSTQVAPAKEPGELPAPVVA